MIPALALPPSPLLTLGGWLIDLRQPVADAAALWAALDPQERERALRLRFDADRLRHGLSHTALRERLALLCGEPPAALRYAYNPEGKPALADHPGLHFNLSHSRQWALIGASRSGPIGVDIEDLQPMDDLQALVDSHFGAHERARFAATPAAERLQAFLRCWTRKEACLKAIGSGLSLEPNRFEAGTDSAPRRTTLPWNDGRFSVDVQTLDLPVNAIAAVAAVAAFAPAAATDDGDPGRPATGARLAFPTHTESRPNR